MEALSGMAKVELTSNMTCLAQILAEAGQLFNQYLVDQFGHDWQSFDSKRVNTPISIPKEHMVFYQTVAQTLGWIQGKDKDKLLPVYLRLLVEARSRDISDIEDELKSALEQSGIDKPRRILGVVASLQTWTRVALPDTRDDGALDLDQIQEGATAGGHNLRWTTLAPLKMYALLKGPSFITPRSILPPIGKAVLRGIEKLFGFVINESAKDYQLSKNLHLKLADLAGVSIWEINSGFYRLGGGS